MEVALADKKQPARVSPDDWQLRAVGQMGEVVTGKALAVNAPGELRPYLRTKNVFDGRIDIDDVLTMPMTDGEFRQFVLKDGDVLLNEGQSLELVGRCALYRGEYREPCAIQNQLLRFRAYPGVSGVFASHLFRYCQQTGVFARVALQTTSIAHLGGKRFERLVLAWPPSEREQRAIAAALSDVDTLLDALTRLIAKKRDIKQAAMQQLLTGTSRLPGFSGAWATKALRDIVSTPITDGPHLTPRFLADGVPFLSVNNLVNNVLDLGNLRFVSREDHLEFSKKCRPRRGDILFGKAASVGMVALIDTDLELNIWSPLALIRVGESSNPRFISYALQARHVHGQIKLLTNSSSQGNIGMGEIGLIEIPVPPLPEQTAIAAVLSDMDAEIAALEARRDKTRALKQGMMQELLTGRTRLV
jgi:type I restriction enzyme S subunit